MSFPGWEVLLFLSALCEWLATGAVFPSVCCWGGFWVWSRMVGCPGGFLREAAPRLMVIQTTPFTCYSAAQHRNKDFEIMEALCFYVGVLLVGCLENWVAQGAQFSRVVYVLHYLENSQVLVPRELPHGGLYPWPLNGGGESVDRNAIPLPL